MSHDLAVSTEVLNELAYRRRVQHLWNCGPRAIAELLAELGTERDVRTTIDEKLKQYSDLDPRVLRAFGADQMPPLPVHVVRR